MKRTIFTSLLILLLALSTNIVKAQVSFGLQGGLGIPMGDFGKNIDINSGSSDNAGGAKTGLGFGFNARYRINNHFTAGVATGFYSFTGPEFYLITPLGSINITSNYSIIPFTLSGKYFFTTEGLKPFIGLDLGYYMVNFEINASAFGQTDRDDKDFNDVGLAPHIGMAYGINKNVDILLNAKYHIVFNEDTSIDFPNSTWLSINFGLAYNLR